MKLLKQKHDDNIHSFIILESLKDLDVYHKLDAMIKSNQGLSFWTGLKSQPDNFKFSATDYVQHECKDNSIARVMAMKLDYNGSETSIVEYCTELDNIINDIHNSMATYINDGMKVRINSVGGYYPIEDIGDHESLVLINEQELYNFLLHKDIKAKFEITSKHLVIENDDYIPTSIIDTYSKLTSTNKDDIQVITSFKMKSILFKKEDFIKFFENGVNNGLRCIILETTTQDAKQIYNIKSILEHVMNKKENLNKKLEVYVKTYGKNKELFDTTCLNIRIIFI